MHTAEPVSTRPVPNVPPAVVRRLPLGVAGATGLAAVVCAGVALATGRSDWWPAFVAATVTAVIGAAVSIAVLSRAAGKRMDWLVTIVMGATVARMGVSLIGLLVAVMGLHTPAEPTGFMICGYYAAVLVAETTLLSSTTKLAGENHA